MNSSQIETSASRSRNETSWLPRLSLYQVCLLFSIVVVLLALRGVDSAREKLAASLLKQVEINRELVVDDPSRLVGILANPELMETRWRIYIPRGSLGQIVLAGRNVAEVTPGYHSVVITVDRENALSFRYDLYVDDTLAAKQFRWNPGQVFLKSTTHVQKNEKLVLGLAEIPSQEPLLWVEAHPALLKRVDASPK